MKVPQRKLAVLNPTGALKIASIALIAGTTLDAIDLQRFEKLTLGTK